MLVKRQQNSTDTAHTEASLSWWCFLPAWLFALAADWVLVQICLYAYLSSMKAAVTLGRILSTWPASCGVRILRREDLQHFTDMSLFACWRFGSGLTRFHLKDQWNCEKIPVAKLLFPSVNWKSGVPSPTVSWSSETLHKSRILAGLFFSLFKHDPRSKPTNGCAAHSLVLQGLHCFASVAIPKSRQRFVTPCINFVDYSVINYRSNNKSYKDNFYHWSQLNRYYISNRSLKTLPGDPCLLCPVRCGIEKSVLLSHFRQTAQIKYWFCWPGS